MHGVSLFLLNIIKIWQFYINNENIINNKNICIRYMYNKLKLHG
jgi:hypothetical protein